MNTNPFQEILDWSEVWAPVIPLVVWGLGKAQPRFLVPVILYLWFALVVDAIIDIGWKVNGVPGWMYPNVYWYNIHSIGRFVLFSAFFYLLHPAFRTKAHQLLPLLVIILLVINFWFFENFFDKEMFSSRLFTVEAGVLLFYCLRYYLLKTNATNVPVKAGKDHWVVTGLSVYVVFNFFYFLFYTTLMADEKNHDFVAAMWNFHNITFIILCIFIARAFYVPGYKRY